MTNTPKEGSIEYFLELGFTQEEAEGFAKSWGFKPPDITKDGEEAYRAYLRAGSEAERERRDQMTDTPDEDGKIWWQNETPSKK